MVPLLKLEQNTAILHCTLAAQGGNTGMVELLLRNSASIETMDKENNTPLHLAAQNGHIGIVQLIENKAAVSMKTAHTNL